MIDNEGVDVIIRLHNVARIKELERAIFSIYGQELRPVRILLTLQRFTDEEEDLVRQALSPIFSLPDSPQLKIIRYNEALPVDARSAMVNLAFQNISARFVGFLDYDDVLYPEAYRILTQRLSLTDAGIVFAGIYVKQASIYDDFVGTHGQERPFRGETLADIFKSNFCPIHSFLVDRTRVGDHMLRFEDQLTVEEDYDFLLRVCSKIPSDFTLINTMIGEYYWKSDSSNTVAQNRNIEPSVRSHIAHSALFMSARRRITVLSEPVQRELGLSFYRPSLTIAEYLGEGG